MKKCNHCKELNQIFKIETPGDLIEAIKVISDNLADATITEDSSKPMGEFTSVPFEDLANGKSWDDIVEYNFKCPKCGLGFCLRAETYHGSGGSWSPYK
jgi:phage FluMu protein Com